MTDNTAAIEREIFIALPPEETFRYLVEPALMARWIGLAHQLDPRPGGVFRVEVSSGNIATGLYVEVAPPWRVTFTWGWESQDASLSLLPPGTSLVEVDLEAKYHGTLLRLRHSRLPRDFAARHAERWSFYLANLQAKATTPATGSQHSASGGTPMETQTIQQSATFGAPPMDVYEMLMDSKKHAALSGEPATISREVGGTFTAWGTHISGFNLVLRPGGRIVQAWRALDWPPDHYSIAIFEFNAVDGGTKLDFTQIGVPVHRYEGHVRGWTQTYWTPIKEILEQGSISAQTRANVEAARQRIQTGNL